LKNAETQRRGSETDGPVPGISFLSAWGAGPDIIGTDANPRSRNALVDRRHRDGLVLHGLAVSPISASHTGDVARSFLAANSPGNRGERHIVRFRVRRIFRSRRRHRPLQY